MPRPKRRNPHAHRKEHRILCSKIRHPPWPQSHIRPNGRLYTTHQGQSEPCPRHCGRRTPQFTRRHHHRLCQSNDHQMSTQKHHFYSWRPIHEPRYQRILLWHRHGTIRVHETCPVMHPRQNYRPILPPHAQFRRLGLLVDPKRHVRPQTSRLHHQLPTQISPSPFWFCPCSQKPCALEAHHQVHHFLPRC